MHLPSPLIFYFSVSIQSFSSSFPEESTYHQFLIYVHQRESTQWISESKVLHLIRWKKIIHEIFILFVHCYFLYFFFFHFHVINEVKAIDLLIHFQGIRLFIFHCHIWYRIQYLAPGILESENEYISSMLCLM